MQTVVDAVAEPRRRGLERVMPAIAIAVGGCSVALAVLGAVLTAANGGAAAANGRDYTFGIVVASIAYGLAGMELTRRGVAVALGVVSLGIAFVLGVTAALTGWALGQWSPNPSDELEVAVWLTNWIWVPGYLAIATVLLLLLPTGLLPTPRWWPAAAVAGLGIASLAMSMALSPYPTDDIPVQLADATNPFTDETIGRVLGIVGFVLVVPAAAISVASLFVRWRRATGFDREQLKWVALGGAATVILFAGAFAAGEHGDVVFALAMVPLPACTAVAVLRHGMWDVDLVISRSLIYTTLTVIVVAVYVAIVAVVTQFVARQVAGVVAVVLVALGMHPLHALVQRRVNRLVYGDRDDPAAALRRLGERLVGAGEAGDVLPAAAETVARALRLPHVQIQVDGVAEASFGQPVGEPMSMALLYQGERVGEFTVSPRQGTTGWSNADLSALDDIGRPLAVAAHAVRLALDLRRSRERLVFAREEERRRLRRDLHDELGPRLAALALELDTARDVASADPAQMDATLERAAANARAGISDVRRIVYDLRPATLDDFGLADAVREQADRLTNDRLSIVVTIHDDVGPLAAAVEVAAYRIASEAMTNAVRHAHAMRCDVALSVQDEWLWIIVTDDGRGLPRATDEGVGLASMRERAEELGGTLELSSSPDAGTRIVAVLPVAG